MHDLASSFVLGFHGCTSEVAERLVLRQDHFKPSENSYDWLGHGIYFWLEDPLRACEWAQRHVRNDGDGQPAVIGGVIDLGRCLDLTTMAGIEAVQSGYEALKAIFHSGLTSKDVRKAGLDFLLPYFDETGGCMPENEPADEKDGDRLIRRLDCAVINMTCRIHEEKNYPFDTVKGVFSRAGRPSMAQGSWNAPIRRSAYAIRNASGAFFFHLSPTSEKLPKNASHSLPPPEPLFPCSSCSVALEAAGNMRRRGRKPHAA